MKLLSAALLVTLSASVFAQAPAAAPSPKAALEITADEVLEAKAVLADYSVVIKEVQTFEAKIREDHPGYEFDLQTQKLVEVKVAPAPVVKPADKK